MPIYEYRCEACGYDLEVLQKIGDAPLTQCPQCGEERLRKQLTAAGFRLKGGGWYETDFKGKKPSKDTNGESAAAKKKEAKPGKDKAASGKSEAKPSAGKASQAGAANG